jgi:hypothetical protein
MAGRGAFVKGWKGGPGRPKGGRNIANAEAKEFAKRLVENPRYRKVLEKGLQERTLEASIEQMLWHYAYGKPKETLDVNWSLDKLSDGELDQLEALVKRVS